MYSFKCRTCGDMLSSSWETEQRKHNMINFDNPKNYNKSPRQMILVDKKHVPTRLNLK